MADLAKELDNLLVEFQQALTNVKDLDALDLLRVDFLGRKGRLAGIMSALPSLPVAERPAFGQKANLVKNQLQELFEQNVTLLNKAKEAKMLATFDPAMPGRLPHLASLHPITIVTEKICEVFQGIGFEIVQGPEVENDYYNFEALNMPKEHPARDMQDSFYLSERTLLRTHTSPVQVRTMLNHKPPLAVVAPGKVYRRDSDMTHTPMFHQIEGLMVGYDISLAHLRGILTLFVQEIFGATTKVRFRPSFFPFTEPSAEVDISCTICQGKGYIESAKQAKQESEVTTCRVCKGSGWLEILGCGMVDPNVFSAVGYASDVTGFAFGLGIERIAMLKYGINDLRMFFENDCRFLSQFSC